MNVFFPLIQQNLKQQQNTQPARGLGTTLLTAQWVVTSSLELLIKLQHDQTCILFTVHHEPKQIVVEVLDFAITTHSSYFFHSSE